MRFTSDELKRLVAVLDADNKSFAVLAKIAGLCPNTDFCGTDLSNVDFGTDDLSAFLFHRTILTGANFSRALGLHREMFAGATWDDETSWPPGLFEGADSENLIDGSSPELVNNVVSSSSLFADISSAVRSAIQSIVQRHAISDVSLPQNPIEWLRDRGRGDLGTNAALLLARSARDASVNELADELAALLSDEPSVESAYVAKPGFVNIRLRPWVWSNVLRNVLRRGETYGGSNAGEGEKVNIEFGSALPTGPMHLAQCRAAVFGDALANLLTFTGYDVTREYYINDAGTDVDVLARSAFLRYREALGEDIGEISEGLYRGDYLKPVGKALAKEHGDQLISMTEAAWLPIVRDKAIAIMMDEIRGDLAALGIRYDIFFSERSLIKEGVDLVAEMINDLRSKGDVYEGRLPLPKGSSVDDCEDRDLTIFRATAYADDVDRPLLKSDGSYTYFAADIAYHKSRFDRGFRNLVDIWAGQNGGYTKRIKAAVAAVTNSKATLDVKIVQPLRLVRNHEPMRMSKRAGDYVTLREVVNEVGADPIRFMMLLRRVDVVLELDIADIKKQTRENPLGYVINSYALARSLLSKAIDNLPGMPKDADARRLFLLEAKLEDLKGEAELSLIWKLSTFPRVVELASVAGEPHRIAIYVHELARAFNSWAKIITKSDAPPVWPIEGELADLQVALLEAFVCVLVAGLSMLGLNLRPNAEVGVDGRS